MKRLLFACLFAALTGWTLLVPAQEPFAFSVKEYLAKTYILGIEISPDARYIAVLTQNDNWVADTVDRTIWIINGSDQNNGSRPVSVHTSRDQIPAMKWSPDGRYLAFLTGVYRNNSANRRVTDEPRQLLLYDAQSKRMRNVTSARMKQNPVTAFDWSASGTLYFSIDDTPYLPANLPPTFPLRSQPEDHSTFYRLAGNEIGKREPSKVMSIPDIALEFIVSADERQMAVRPGTVLFLVDVDKPDAPKQLTPSLGCMEGLRWIPAGILLQSCSGVRDSSSVGKDGKFPRNTPTVRTQRRQYLVDPVEARTQQLAPDYDGEIWERAVTPDGDLLAIGLKSTKWTFYRVDVETRKADAIPAPGIINNISVSQNGKLVAFSVVEDGEVFLATGLDQLASARRVTEYNTNRIGWPRVETRTVNWSNGEGDTVEGVLYFPPGKTDAKGLPTVVEIHGGPWMARSEPFYAPLAGTSFDVGPLLASRGYLVLAVNYRGGTGRGDKFLADLNGYPCSRPAVDIITGVDHLIAQGWADPNRLGIMGGSYGGIATNCTISRTSKFKAAVTAAGVWNFTSAYTDSGNSPAHSNTAPWEDLRLYWEESPISRAANIKTPTLIIHGEEDRQLSVSQAREMQRALNRLRVPNALLVFPNEGHGNWTKASIGLTYREATIAWFDHYLLGKPLPKQAP